MNKVGILINDEIDDFLSFRAKRMGTSKRNVISLVISDILEQDIKKERLDKLKRKTNGLNHPTTITVSEPFLKKISQINKHGYSIRLFLGLLLFEFFHENEHLGHSGVISVEDLDKKGKRDDLKPIIDKQVKEKIKNYCWEHALTVSSLYTNFILEKPITVKNYFIKNKEMLTLNFSIEVKEEIDRQVEEKNINYNIFFNLISAQICEDLNL